MTNSNSMIPLLPMMEMVYKQRKIPSYKFAHSEAKGTYVVAASDITGGAVVLIEKAIYVQPTKNHPSLLQEPKYQCLMESLGKEDPSAPSTSGNNKKAAKDCLLDQNKQQNNEARVVM